MGLFARIVVAVLVGAGSLLLTAAGRGAEGELGGFVIGHVPPAAGDDVSDFATVWGGVDFSSRVWEREVDDGYRVDLKINVLRGERLSGVDELRDFLAEYHERDPEEWERASFHDGAYPGYRSARQAFWLVRPGVGVSVRLYSDRLDTTDLEATVAGVRPSAG
ncbi:hypothetical protein FHX37_0557 [Haloactinospora alba]|uniref:Uncharacterized protein n=1 Tax=Haloactinospora alba TaxID=405555 RepID=A0A543NFS3_9ACTN|nr:hypothetical protein [Haloactinospora alba]TQN30675.1 hypothetical protein FHX37_0557 [Haloactinospora alba]